jgi:tRNA 2-thiouridine synthesizing protein B
VLHIVKSSPYRDQALTLCLNYIDQDSVIVLISDAVLAGVDKSEWATRLFTGNHVVYLLSDDVHARGLGDKLHPSAVMIEMNKLVSLSVEHVTQMTW